MCPDFSVFFNFYADVMTETWNSDNAIEFYAQNCINGPIFKKGIQKIPALVPHPTVLDKYSNECI